MKNQNQDKPHFSQPKLFSIQLNLHFFVICLLAFSCGIVIGAVFFSSFPENLISLSLKLHDNVNNSTSLPIPLPIEHFSLPPISKGGNQTIEMLNDSTLVPDVNVKELKTNKTSLETLFDIRGDFMHDMGEAELMMKASMVANDELERIPKVAFLFLVKGSMPLVPFWERFFKGSQGLYSIYVHSSPSYNATFSEDSVFHGRRIPSKEVEWGNFNMVEAERRLLANALLDSSNERFVLLSESCIPLYNFQTIYFYLINSKETFVEAYDQPGAVGRFRYSRRMQPQVTLSQWRKGSQWFQIDRDLALQVVLDDKYFPIFKKYCRGSCYGDEHYLPTYVNINFPQRNSNRTLTWVDWSRSGPHPGKFERLRVTVEFLEDLRNKRNCTYNGEEGNICFLFARKFQPSSLIRLMLFATKVFKIQ